MGAAVNVSDTAAWWAGTQPPGPAIMAVSGAACSNRRTAGTEQQWVAASASGVGPSCETANAVWGAAPKSRDSKAPLPSAAAW